MARRTLPMLGTIAVLSLSLQACGGQCDCATQAGTDGTAGGEGAPPMAIRTTTPIPVPQPAVPREELSEALQSVWSHVEEAVAVRVPDAPEATNAEAVQEWADGPFRAWVERRTEMSRSMRDLASEMSDEHQHNVAERAVAAALFGYLYEDFAAGAHGAPIPENVANDPELLGAYMSALDDELMPVVERAFDAFMYCASHVSEELSETPWASWGLYCFQRASEIDQVYAVSMRRHFREVEHRHPAEIHHPGDEHPEGGAAGDGEASEGGASEGGASEGGGAEAAGEEPVSSLVPSIRSCDLPTSV